jgi:hypothetical protein
MVLIHIRDLRSTQRKIGDAVGAGAVAKVHSAVAGRDW